MRPRMRKYALAYLGAAARDDAVFVGQLDFAVSDAGKYSHREHERHGAENLITCLILRPLFYCPISDTDIFTRRSALSPENKGRNGK